MGLDMYLNGQKYFYTADGECSQGAEEIRKTGETYRLGYWRKHPNLHGFIVETFAAENDDCRPVELDAKGIRLIMKTIRQRKLPHTTGFFFGQSEGDKEETQCDLETFAAALAWLEADEPRVWRSINYQASW